MLTVVTGPPCAGKSTYVAEHANPGDIVIDLDRLARALTGYGADDHDHDQRVRIVAHGARAGALSRALHMTAEVDVYVIDTAPTPAALRDYHRLDARIVTLDPGFDVVMARAAAERTSRTANAIASWYANRAR